MKNTWSPRTAIACVAVSLAISPLALAQDDDGLIEEIMVTATKREQSIYEVPVAVSAFQGDQLAQQGICLLYTSDAADDSALV